MQKLQLLILFLIFLFVSCSGDKKKNREEILKQGAVLYTQYGCIVCHSLDGKIVYGPPLNDIYLKKIEVIRNGETLTVIADRDYLKKAITEPRFEKVKEYHNKEMPLTNFSEEEAELLVEYIILLNKENMNEK